MEHRWSVRKPHRCRIVVDTPRHGRIPATLKDVGIGGMFIATDGVTLPLNTPLQVAFSLLRDTDRDDFRLPAMVVRQESMGAAVMFLDIDVETLRALRLALYESNKPEVMHDPSAPLPSKDDRPTQMSRVAHG